MKGCMIKKSEDTTQVVENVDKEHVTPWDVDGVIDYEKLIQQFGTQKLSSEIKKELSENILVRRGFYYSHRDFDKVMQDHKSGKNFFLYTGRAPSGTMHIGHLFSFLITKFLQDKYNVNVYIQIPDEEKFFVKQDLSLKDIDQWVDDLIAGKPKDQGPGISASNADERDAGCTGHRYSSSCA